MQDAIGEPDEASNVLAVTLSESRYDRQERVTWWEQQRLARARVVVVGAGALGNEVVKNLALVGVGDIVVIDLDVVELSNLSRCVFFRPDDEGRPKAEALAVRSGELNADVRISGIVGDVRSFGTGLALRADVIVGALDNREARLFCNRLAARVGRAWVDGAIEALCGIARVFAPPDTCYECTMSELDWQALAHRQSCRLLSVGDLIEGKVPTTATTASIVAGLQAQEVVKLLHAGRPGVHGLSGAIVIDGANNDAYPLAYPHDPDCLAHHRFESPITFANANPASFAQLAIAAWGPDLGGATAGTPLVVELGDDHVTSWRCTVCDERAWEGKPLVLITADEARCPRCGEPRQPELTTSVGVPGPHANSSIGEFGVRLDEVLVVRRGVEERAVWFAEPDPRLPDSWREPVENARPSTAHDGSSSPSGTGVRDAT